MRKSIILFYLGGMDYVDGEKVTVLDLAAKYDGSWERIGNLLQPRSGHRSILQGNKILHIGGWGGSDFE